MHNFRYINSIPRFARQSYRGGGVDVGQLAHMYGGGSCRGIQQQVPDRIDISNACK